jgi:BatD DUF11 like domain
VRVGPRRPSAAPGGFRRLGLVGLLVFGAAAAVAEEPQITARLEPSAIGIDETALFRIDIATGLGGSLQGEPQFELDNLDAVQGPSRSESFSFVNGTTSRSLILIWRLRPRALGPARVRGIRFVTKDRTVELADQEITVQQEPTGVHGNAPVDPFGRDLLGQTPLADPLGPFGRSRRGARPVAAQPKLFLRAVAEPQRPYVGQQVLYTVFLYTQAAISAVNPSDVPDFRGFWAIDIPQPEREVRPDMVTEEGERYGRVALLQKALFPIQPGRLEIPEFVVDLGVRVSDPGMFGLLTSIEEVRRRSAPVVVEVQALPPAPPGFQGAVGRLEVDARLEPRELEAGQAATLTLSLSGQGHLTGLADPVLPALPGLRTYPPEKEGREEVVGTLVRGRRSWRYVLVPERGGTFELPGIEIPHFDPAAAAYRVASSPPLRLLARENVAVAAAAATPAAAPPTAQSPPPPSGWRQVRPWAMAGVGAVALLAGVGTLVRRRAHAIPGDRAHLRALRGALAVAHAEPRPRQSAAAMEEAWRSYLCARWAIPAGTPSPQWRNLLGDKGVEPGLASALQALADDLHYLRYAPQLSSAEALAREARAKSKQLLRACR